MVHNQMTTKQEKIEVFSRLYYIALDGTLNQKNRILFNRIIMENIGYNGLKKVKKMAEKLTDCCKKPKEECKCYDKTIKENGINNKEKQH